MTLRLNTSDGTFEPATALWIALITALTVAGSFAFTCAAPFAAIAALAALTMRPLEGLALVLVTWLVNQAVGFLLLGFPHTVSTFGWGVAIAVATIAGYFATRAILKIKLSSLATVVVSLLVAFCVYELALFGYGRAVGYAGNSLTSPEIIAQVFLINAGGFFGLFVLHRLAVALALLRPIPSASPATA